MWILMAGQNVTCYYTLKVSMLSMKSCGIQYSEKVLTSAFRVLKHLLRTIINMHLNTISKIRILVCKANFFIIEGKSKLPEFCVFF